MQICVPWEKKKGKRKGFDLPSEIKKNREEKCLKYLVQSFVCVCVDEWRREEGESVREGVGLKRVGVER